jgi:hypothetical protein
MWNYKTPMIHRLHGHPDFTSPYLTPILTLLWHRVDGFVSWPKYEHVKVMSSRPDVQGWVTYLPNR